MARELQRAGAMLESARPTQQRSSPLPQAGCRPDEDGAKTALCATCGAAWPMALHGEGTAEERLRPETYCAVCGLSRSGETRVAVETAHAARMAEYRTAQERQAEEEARRRLVDTELPAGYQNPSLEKVGKDVRAEVTAYCDQIAAKVKAGAGMVIGGGVGCGKSHILGLIALAACRAGMSTRYILGTRLADALCKQARGSPGDTPTAAWGEPWARVRLLLIDDFDAALLDAAGWPLGEIETLIETRYAEGLATCVTMNHRWATLEARPELARITDRLRERCVVLHTADKSRRVSYSEEGETR